MTPQRILDLDLDFFLDHVATWRSDDDPRLSDDEYHPWDEMQVREFLEKHCGLSLQRPIPGKLVKHHDEAFVWWRDLIEQGDLTPPFEIVHVDAHSDTGFNPGDRYLMTELLHLPPEERTHPRSGWMGMNAGNYLCFAVACRWVSKIVFVLHLEWESDFGLPHFRDKDPSSFLFQLKQCTLDSISGPINSMFGPSKFVAEPEVPFEIFFDRFNNDKPFTHGLLSQSPGFTPQSVDKLITIVMEYFSPG